MMFLFVCLGPWNKCYTGNNFIMYGSQSTSRFIISSSSSIFVVKSLSKEQVVILGTGDLQGGVWVSSVPKRAVVKNKSTLRPQSDRITETNNNKLKVRTTNSSSRISRSPSADFADQNNSSHRLCFLLIQGRKTQTRQANCSQVQQLTVEIWNTWESLHHTISWSPQTPDGRTEGNFTVDLKASDFGWTSSDWTDCLIINKIIYKKKKKSTNLFLYFM